MRIFGALGLATIILIAIAAMPILAVLAYGWWSQYEASTPSERSVRYAALDALLYNFPDQRVLSDPIGKAGWSAAEKFCVNTIGAVLDGPTPDIPRDQAYPTNILPLPQGM